ncbi:Crp/Fnr family transcriptional regulator [Maribacter sp. 2-571]|uniref:Crp/Fnr family transcriptional regulator n=1 Tax=Maribacter sp. 2-571 TaxID=3417569 RepID=UPI003D3382BA
MEALGEYIRSYFGVSSDALHQILPFFEIQSLPKGTFYTKQDTYCTTLSFVKEGYLRIFAETEHREVTQWIASSGYFVTDMSSFMFHQKARFSIQALTDCETFTIKRADYQKLQETVDDWPMLEKMFLTKCFVTLENRVFELLSLPAAERYRLFFEANKEMFRHVPLQYIATMLGMTPETLSRIRAKKTS